MHRRILPSYRSWPVVAKAMALPAPPCDPERSCLAAPTPIGTDSWSMARVLGKGTGLTTSEELIMRRLPRTALFVLTLCLAAAAAMRAASAPAYACGDETGLSCDSERDDARTLLKAAVAAVKKNESQALGWFTAQSHGFRTQDLYVFCIGPDHIMDAHPDPKIRGTDAEKLVDDTGFAFGDAMIKAAQEGAMNDITYMWPRLGETKPYVKHTLFTRVADQVCAVGYYE